ncbi:hypothetical protein NHX12_019400 [Muraenolepis orangiensis]|uniref:Uncharacterized protein n=1 Tax=Muraenolepis orangiensis TaxID=630683 RepID=A0A9Q0EVA5_9TELE|nr:hypothetical protein NHX12_019400 [Muraenolepis orangiensis]
MKSVKADGETARGTVHLFADGPGEPGNTPSQQVLLGVFGQGVYGRDTLTFQPPSAHSSTSSKETLRRGVVVETCQN